MDGIARDGLSRQQIEDLAANAESRAVRRRARTRLADMPEPKRGGK